jgi:hypothetical protein
VQEAQKEFLREMGASSVEAFVEECCVETKDYKEAKTEAKMMAAFIRYMEETMSKAQAHAAFELACIGVIVAGRLICKTKHAHRGVYITLKPVA